MVCCSNSIQETVLIALLYSNTVSGQFRFVTLKAKEGSFIINNTLLYEKESLLFVRCP